jgi:GT2 family glycosyltransferase
VVKLPVKLLQGVSQLNKLCDIVIPVYNAPQWLELCIESIFLSDVSKCVNKVVLVDDCSDEPTKQLINDLRNKHEKIHVITNWENMGFVKSCNKGMKASSGDYIMLLNSDCLLAEDSTKKLIDILETTPQGGLVSPLSNNAANLTIDIPPDFDYVKLDKMLKSRFSGKSFSACTIIGNCLVISRDCYEKTGELDEAFGKGYGEETDYQFRAKKQGFKALVAIDTYVYHKSEMSFKDVSDIVTIRQKNRELFLSKWGKEYRKDYKAYKKNDPVEFVINNLNEIDYREFSVYKSETLNKKFIDKIIQLNRESQDIVNNAESGEAKPSSLTGFVRSRLSRARELYRIKGIKFVFVRTLSAMSKIVKKFYYNTVKNMRNSHFKDFIFISENRTAIKKARRFASKLGYHVISADFENIRKLDKACIKRYRGFVFFDCGVSKSIEEFITEAKKLNKSIFWTCRDEELLSQLDAESLSGLIVSDKKMEELALKKGFPAYYVEDSYLNSEADAEASNEAGLALRDYLFSRLNKSIAFILPSTRVCGGMNVIVQHCEMLQKNGYDTVLINMERDETSCFINNREIPVISYEAARIECSLDTVVATMWITVKCMDSLPKVGRKLYLVQNFETDFYTRNDLYNRKQVNDTYIRNDIGYLTISLWCKKWLSELFGKEAVYIRNGIDINTFKESKRDFNGRITILIEGDCEADYKNVDESFAITNELDREKYEVSYLSYRGKPKKWYQFDRFYHKIPYEKVAEIYNNAHIMLKTSLLESFSYPLIEMMATGGIVVAVQNGGNKEIAIDNHNCLIYEQGNIPEALEKIKLVLEDEQLRNKLISNGMETAGERAWEEIEPEIVKGYSSHLTENGVFATEFSRE